MKVEILYENPWLELRKMVEPESGVNGYVYSHEKRCNGKILSILPYATNFSGPLSFLLRKEVTPCWAMAPITSSITGGYDGGDMEDNVIRELEEEAGYKIDRDELINLGTCFGTKSSDTVYYLYTVDLTGKEKGKAEGDGSELEAKAHCFWADSIDDSLDPLAYVAHQRLRNLLKSQTSRPVLGEDIKAALSNMDKFLKSQQDLDPKYADIINKQFWEFLK